MKFFGFSGDKDVKYKISNIYAGVVTTPSKFFCDGKNSSTIMSFSAYPRNIYRKILFYKNEDNNGEDLLYSDFTYKVEGFGNVIDQNSDKFVIGLPIPLGETLDYFGRPKYIKESDIKSVYNDFLRDDKFIEACSDIFGISEFGFGSFSEHVLDPEVYKNLTFISRYTKNPDALEQKNSKVRTRFISL